MSLLFGQVPLVHLVSQQLDQHVLNTSHLGNMLKEAWATNFALEADSCDSDAIANMVSIRAPVKKTFNSFDEAREYALWLNHTLWRKYRVEVPCTVLNETQIYIRISAQIYNTKEDFYALRDASLEICA